MNEKERVCGNCTACCKTHAVHEIKKPEGEWCNNCLIGKGCKIYFNKPEGCNDFKCDWLKGFGEENDRPDKTKVIIDSFYDDDIGKLIMLWEVSEGSFDKEYAKNLIINFIYQDIITLKCYLNKTKRHLLLPFNRKLNDKTLVDLKEEGIKVSIVKVQSKLNK